MNTACRQSLSLMIRLFMIPNQCLSNNVMTFTVFYQAAIYGIEGETKRPLWFGVRLVLVKERHTPFDCFIRWNSKVHYSY